MHPLFADGHALADLVVVFFAAVVMPALSTLAGLRLSRAMPASLIGRYVRTIARGWLVTAALCGVWLWAGRPFSALGLDVPIGFRGQMGLLFDLSVVLAMSVPLLRMKKSVSPERLAKLQEQMRALKIVPRNVPELLVFLLVSVTAGIWEELLYRGFLLWFLTPLTGVTAAIAVSSLMFGLGHVYQGWRGIPRTAFLGAIFAIFYAATNSLWWVMLAHALVDVFGGLVGLQLSRMARSEIAATRPAPSVAAILSVVA